MTANERREEIIKNLVKEKKAITGSELASYFNVTRQVIVKDIAIKFNDEGKIVAAICAAPQTLEQFGILDDKKCTSYPGFIKGREKVNYL